MQWDDSPNGGFTTGTPWLKVNPNYKRINAAAQRQDPHSVYHCYKKLIALRKDHPALTRGELEFVDTPEQELLCLRRVAPEETLLCVNNFSKEEKALPQGLVPEGAQVLLSSYDREGGWRPGCASLRPYESALFLVK